MPPLAGGAMALVGAPGLMLTLGVLCSALALATAIAVVKNGR